MEILYHPKMRDYQRKALEFACANPASYMAVDLGLGKTLVAIQWIKTIKKPTLVFAPLRVALKTWPDEIKKWAPELRYAVLHGPDKDILFNRIGIHIFIINYEGIKWLYQKLQANPRKWGTKAVIFDEAARLKDPSTKRFKILGKIQRVFKTERMALSGEPAPNGLHELWSQYKVLGYSPIGRTYTSFRNKYFTFNPLSYRTQPLKNTPEKIFNLVKPITFRLDATDYKLMPEVIYNDIKVDLPSKLWSYYNELETDLFTDIEDDIINPANAMVLSGKLRQFAQGAVYCTEEAHNILSPERKVKFLHTAKIEALIDIIESNPGKSILCVIQFRFELDLLKKVKLKFDAIVGGTTTKSTLDIITRWNNKQIPLLVVHPASVSEGLNLQYGGNIIAWLGLPWNPAMYRQLNGRLIRPDQENTVVVNNIVIDKTIDTHIARVCRVKTAVQADLLSLLKSYRDYQLST